MSGKKKKGVLIFSTSSLIIKRLFGGVDFFFLTVKELFYSWNQQKLELLIKGFFNFLIFYKFLDSKNISLP